MVPQGIWIMYTVECTFAGETTELAAEFSDLVAAATAANEYFEYGYDVAIIHKGHGSHIVARHGANEIRFGASFAGA